MECWPNCVKHSHLTLFLSLTPQGACHKDKWLLLLNTVIKFLKHLVSVLTLGWLTLVLKIPEGKQGWISMKVLLKKKNPLCSDSILPLKLVFSACAVWGKPKKRLWEQTCHGTSLSYFITLRMPFLPPRSVIACICHLLANPCELKISPKRFMKAPCELKPLCFAQLK